MTDLFLKIVNMSLSASVVILAVVAARFLLRGAPKKWSYLLWSVVGFRLACPVSLTSVVSIFRAVPVKPVVAPVGQASAIQYIPTFHPQVEASSTAPAPVFDNGLALPAPSYYTTPSGAMTTAPSIAPTDVALLVCAMVWVIGMAVLLIYTVVSYLETRRTVSTAIQWEGNVWQSDQVGSPFILGFVRPKIYIPFGLEGERLQYVLEHERYHIRRGDPILKALAFALLTVHWFNPLCWLAFYLMGKDMELSCDEKVLKQNHNIRKAYSTTLLSFATGGKFPNPSPLAFGETAVKTRIKNALNWKQPKTWVTLLAAVAALTLVVSCAVNPAAEGPRESEGPVESQSPAPVQTNAPLRTSGEYGNVENYVNHMMDRMDKATYYNDNGPVMVGVADRKLDWLEKQGELAGLAPNGTLELWTYNILVKLPETIDPNTVILAGGMYGKDGYFDLEGQGGHRLIALTYSDGTCDILYDAIVNDGGDLPGLTAEEALYNWYVTHYDTGLPPYLIYKTVDRPEEYGGPTNVELRLYQGDGWYIYIPTSAWSLGTEGAWTDWVSQYSPDAYLVVQYVTGPTERPNPGEYRAETYYDKGDGTGWYVTTSYDPRYTPWDEFSGRGMVPGELSLMASTFTVDDRATRTVPPQYTPPTGETFGFTGEYATLYTAVARELGAGLRGVAGSGYEVILPSLTVYGSYPADEAVYFGGETVKEATHYVCYLHEHYYYGFDRLSGTHLMEGGGGSLARITLSADGQDVHIDQEWDGADNTQHIREICGPYTDVAAFYNRETQTQPPHTDLKADLGQYVRWCWEKSGLAVPVSDGESAVTPVPATVEPTPAATPSATPEPSPSPAVPIPTPAPEPVSSSVDDRGSLAAVLSQLASEKRAKSISGTIALGGDGADLEGYYTGFAMSRGDCQFGIANGFTYTPADGEEVPQLVRKTQGAERVALSLSDGTALEFFQGLELIRLTQGDALRFYRAAPKEGTTAQTPYNLAREWYDECEYWVLEHETREQGYQGEDPVERARASADANDTVHTRVSPGSKYRWNLLNLLVEEVSNDRVWSPKDGDPVRVATVKTVTVFLPENSRALAEALSPATLGQTLSYADYLAGGGTPIEGTPQDAYVNWRYGTVNRYSGGGLSVGWTNG